ncbi:hypothetical protein LXL04_029790 [Taraxacum kok-saghyz]
MERSMQGNLQTMLISFIPHPLSKLSLDLVSLEFIGARSLCFDFGWDSGRCIYKPVSSKSTEIKVVQKQRKVFTTRENLKEWVDNVARNLGIVLKKASELKRHLSKS